jgi:predicted  nucleic acid-binding Zn-ribbon protein
VDDKYELKEAFIRLESQLERMMDGIAVVKDEIEAMAEDISKIKEAVYNPDEGIYARIRSLEAWKSTSTRITWIMFTSIVGLASLGLWQLLFPQLNV